MNEYHEKDEFGNRMKSFERSSETFLDLSQPIVVRIDGKRFSKFTKGMVKPFDKRLTMCMLATTQALIEELHANSGYTQSDEITLVFLPKDGKTHVPFDGRVQKMSSVFAAIATSNFMSCYMAIEREVRLLGKDSEFYIENGKPFSVDATPYFDCRVFNVPDLVEATNALLWRIQDARKNSVSCVYRWRVGHSAMQNLSSSQMKEDMAKREIDFDGEYADTLRSGSLAIREYVEREREDGTKFIRGVYTTMSGEEFADKPFTQRLDMFERSVKND